MRTTGRGINYIELFLQSVPGVLKYTLIANQKRFSWILVDLNDFIGFMVL